MNHAILQHTDMLLGPTVRTWAALAGFWLGGAINGDGSQNGTLSGNMDDLTCGPLMV